jgi:hypothetical protein
MDSLRLISANGLSRHDPCSQCAAAGSQWDRIVGRPYCPDCEETLALGEGAALILRTQSFPCAVCDRVGAVSFLTFPLHGERPLEMYLCPEHFRALLGRRLGPHAFHQLRRRLELLGLAVERIFLLHEVFYDAAGRALQPLE